MGCVLGWSLESVISAYGMKDDEVSHAQALQIRQLVSALFYGIIIIPLVGGLAAGMGTKLRPLTLTTPKSLISVNGQPMLERQIELLKEKGIDEIIVVTGDLKEKFEYLKEKYNVKLVHNDKYDKYNNIYTMYLVR